MSQLTTLKNFRTKLQRAYYSGAKEVTVEGVKTVFDNGAAMQARLRDLDAEISRLEGGKQRPRAASIDLSGGV